MLSMLMCIRIYPITMVNVGYHHGTNVVYVPRFESVVKHLGTDHLHIITVNYKQSHPAYLLQ